MVPETVHQKRSPLRSTFTLTLTAGILAAFLLTGCGGKDQEQASGPAGQGETGSSCVACHTDKEKLKLETASIKKPPSSAMTSGKG